jgi:hypothetical protein
MRAAFSSKKCGKYYITSMAYAEIFFLGGSINSVEDRGQREQGSGGRSPLVRGSTHFANE